MGRLHAGLQAARRCQPIDSLLVSVYDAFVTSNVSALSEVAAPLHVNNSSIAPLVLNDQVFELDPDDDDLFSSIEKSPENIDAIPSFK